MSYLRKLHKGLGVDDLNRSARCPECCSNRLMISRGKLTCTNCDHVIGNIGKTNKYGAKRTEMNGKIYDSKFEATVAADLEIQKRAGQILGYDTQFKVEGWVYDSNGRQAFSYSHKVDFRIHNLDGSFELREAKGVETDDYKWRRKILENVWLPEHPDHEYVVVYQGKPSRRVQTKK